MNLTESRLIHIAIADDHTLIRQSLCNLINSFSGFIVDFEASNGLELLSGLGRAINLPDICVIDINMPEKNGYETLREIKCAWPSMKCLILTFSDTEYSVQNMIKIGANGYILKSCSSDEFREALLSVYKKDFYHSGFVADSIYHSLQNRYKFPNISEREAKFLSLCGSEKTYKEIAEIMHVSIRTVEGYRDSLFGKLHLKTRIGLAIYALNSGLALC